MNIPFQGAHRLFLIFLLQSHSVHLAAYINNNSNTMVKASIEYSFFVGYLVCLGFFLSQAYSFVNQYLEYQTALNFQVEKHEVYQMPVMTFCPFPVYKTNIFPMTKSEFDANTFQLEEIFINKVLT